jgi:ABC-type transport system substrate-binding protein
MATTGGSASAAAGDIDYDATAKVAIYDTFSGWCFANNLANSALMAGRTIYETLFEKSTTNDLVGLLATKGEPVANSGLKQWKVTLRTGIKFHDGTDFDAAAVVDNWQYGSAGDGTLTTTYWGAMLAEFSNLSGYYLGDSKGGPSTSGLGPNMKFPAAGVKITPTVGAGKTAWITTVTAKQVTTFNNTVKKELAAGGTRALPAKYLPKALFGAAGKAKNVAALSYQASTAVAFGANILAVVATGTHEVTYLLNRAQNDFLGTTYASGRSFQRAPSQFNDGAGDCVSTAVGTGPFELARTADWSTNKLKVVRNENYWRKDALGNKLPYLKQITFENVKETAQRANAIVRGTYDAAMFGSGDGKFNQTLRKSAAVAEVKSAVEYYPSLWLNQGKPGSAFANKDARLAVMTCIDRAGYLKVRAANEGTVAKSLVGPTNIMYNTTGFSGKLQVAASKRYVAKYKAATKKKTLTFTIPSDVSTTSIANIKFLQDQWKKCGITAVAKKSEAADIIAKAFNASPDTDAAEFYNAYDAIAILLMEGDDATFNMPFVLTNAYSTGSTVSDWGGTPLATFYGPLIAAQYMKAGLAQGAAVTAATADATNIAVAVGTKAAIFSGSLGKVLGLNHHSDTAVDDKFFAAGAATTPAEAKTKYAEATAYLQANGTMTSIVHGYYNMFYNKKAGLKGFGLLTLPKTTDVAAGLTSNGDVKQRKISNWGVDWTGVYKLVK